MAGVYAHVAGFPAVTSDAASTAPQDAAKLAHAIPARQLGGDRRNRHLGLVAACAGNGDRRGVG
jgi:hypothetical protein